MTDYYNINEAEKAQNVENWLMRKSPIYTFAEAEQKSSYTITGLLIVLNNIFKAQDTETILSLHTLS